MSGNSSQSTSPSNFDPGQISQFAATNEGKQFSPEELQLLQTAQQRIDKNGVTAYYSNRGGIQNPIDPTLGMMDITALVQTYQKWQGDNNNAATNYANYVSAKNAQPGIQQTILTGPQSGALPSILGGKS